MRNALLLSACLAAMLAWARDLPADDNPLPEPIELTGQWQALLGHGQQIVATQPERFDGWQPMAVPGQWPNFTAPAGWAITRFQAPAGAAGLDCEILLERVQWSAEVWLNGRRLGSWPDGYSPFRVLAGEAIRPGAENLLAIRVGGYAEVPKGRAGNPLFPAGFAMAGRGGGGGIMGRVFVRFYRKVRITQAQVIPDLDKGVANVIVRVEGPAEQTAVKLAVSESGGRPDEGAARIVGQASADVKLSDGVGQATIPVAIKDVKPWSPDRPFLYRLVAVAEVAGRLADRRAERFGMRQVACRADGFYLNGHKLRLLGSNIMADFGYWRGAANLFGTDKIKSVLIDPARAMNAVCIRTHTGPIPKWWLDVCDEQGLLVLLEFPVTVNCGRIDFDQTELDQWKRNMRAEAAAVIGYLANHPSIVMWVATNESNNWHEWERTELWEHFKKLDPSRPTIRAAYDTPDARDVHSYAGIWKGSDGDFEFRCRIEAERARRDKLPVMISEYLDGADIRVVRKWFGPAADSADPRVRQRLAEQVAEFQAERASEQTEAARRLGYCCILPFGPGFWGVRPDSPNKPRPSDYAVPSALAPVGVSIDQADQHFAADSGQTTDVWVINDTPNKVAVTLTVQLSAEDPGFDPAAAPPKPIQSRSFTLDVDGHGSAIRRFAWKAPADEGRYYLLARVERDGAAPASSRRVIYSIRRQPAPKALTGKKVLVLEEPGAGLADWAGRLGCSIVDRSLLGKPAGEPGSLPPALAEAQLVVLGRRATSQPEFRPLLAQLPAYCQRGGHVVVLEQFNWPAMKDLFGIQIERTDYDYDDDNAPADQRGDKEAIRVSQSQASGGSSRVFRWEQPERAIWKGVPDEYLWRWNGQHGRVARVSMSVLPGRARVLVKYAEAERDDLRFVPVAAVPHGQGEVLFFMLVTEGRYAPADPDFDPIAERLMMNLLEY